MPTRNQEEVHRYWKRYPWAKTLRNIKVSCNSHRSRYYKRGIKNLITLEQLKYLWFRDKAYLMKKPSIDRIDGTGNYVLENCRYLELQENLHRPRTPYPKFVGWAKLFEKCSNCGTTKVKHSAFGLCRNCYYEFVERKRRNLKDFRPFYQRKRNIY